MNEPQLRQLLNDAGLGRVVDGILQRARPAIRAHTRPTSEAMIPPGASKMGGLPDLPTGFAYPRWHEPMKFIGQFNLASTHKFDRENLLPERGLLSFFYETDGEPLHSETLAGLPLGQLLPREERRKGWRVLYFEDDPTQFTRFTPTDGFEEDMFYPPCGLRFANALTLPFADTPELLALNLTQQERTALLRLEQQINAGEFGDHQLLGHAYELEPPLLITAAGRFDEWRLAAPQEQRRITQEVNQRWMPLLQVSSSSDLDMDWGGGGYVYFCIERDRLAVRDFSQVSLMMQFL